MRTLLFSIMLSVSLFGSMAMAKRPPPHGFVCGRDTPVETGPSCVEVACDLLGGPRFCSSQANVQDVEQACLNNYSGNCLRNSCARLGYFGCSSIQEIKTVAGSCQGACDHSCAQAACEFVSCRDEREVADVNMACTGQVSGDCVRAECSKSRCGSQDDIRKATRACGGLM